MSGVDGDRGGAGSRIIWRQVESSVVVVEVDENCRVDGGKK